MTTAIPQQANTEAEDAAELALRFQFIRLRDDQAERYDAIWDGAFTYAKALIHLCPESAERDSALHSLEIVVFEANAAVARRLPVQP